MDLIEALVESQKLYDQTQTAYHGAIDELGRSSLALSDELDRYVNVASGATITVRFNSCYATIDGSVSIDISEINNVARSWAIAPPWPVDLVRRVWVLVDDYFKAFGYMHNGNAAFSSNRMYVKVTSSLSVDNALQK